MAVNSLAKLKSRLAYLANRDDLFTAPTWTLTVIDDALSTAILNTTATISRDLAKRGGTGLQETLTDALSTASGVETVALPATLAGIKYFGLRTNPALILSPNDFTTLINTNKSTSTDKPTAYATVGITTAYLRPIPDAIYALRLIYFANLADLTALVTNPIFTAHPDIYEACGMVELGLFLENEATANRWRVVYEQKMNDMTSQDRMSGWAAAMSGATPSVQINIA